MGHMAVFDGVELVQVDIPDSIKDGKKWSYKHAVEEFKASGRVNCSVV